MTQTNNGGPAFPTRPFTATERQQGCDETESGMTLLDHWAGQIAAAYICGTMANPDPGLGLPEDEELARDSYDHADAMLAEKRRREEEDK